MSDFKALYTSAVTYKEMALAIVTLSDNAIYEMISSMQAVNDTTGLDMKQVSLLAMLRQVIRHRNEWDHLTKGELAEQRAGC
jgi:purine-nucleoside phosphorylase